MALDAVDRAPGTRTLRHEGAPLPREAPLAPQFEQFIHDNPHGVLTSFRRNGMP